MVESPITQYPIVSLVCKDVLDKDIEDISHDELAKIIKQLKEEKSKLNESELNIYRSVKYQYNYRNLYKVMRRDINVKDMSYEEINKYYRDLLECKNSISFFPNHSNLSTLTDKEKSYINNIQVWWHQRNSEHLEQEKLKKQAYLTVARKAYREYYQKLCKESPEEFAKIACDDQELLKVYTEYSNTLKVTKR